MNTKNILILVVLVALLGGTFWFIENRGKIYSKNTMSNSSGAPASSVGSSDFKGQEHTVNLTASGFEPQSLTIKAGEKVVWVNETGVAATVSSNNHPTHLLYPKLNLGGFNGGEQLSLVFDTPGTYGYHNHLDPSQTGEITVE